jgi:hypothetical protein
MSNYHNAQGGRDHERAPSRSSSRASASGFDVIQVLQEARGGRSKVNYVSAFSISILSEWVASRILQVLSPQSLS